MATPPEPIDFKDGWEFLEQNGFSPLLDTLEEFGDAKLTFKAGQLVELSLMVYRVCSSKQSAPPPPPQREDLYRRVEKRINQYLEEKVLKAVTEKELHGEFLLKELVKRWNNHCILVGWVSNRFRFLDLYYVKEAVVPKLAVMGFRCFKETVFSQINNDVRHAVLQLVQQERSGQVVDTYLLRCIKDIFVEMGMNILPSQTHESEATGLQVYEQELEEPFLNSTKDFYRAETAKWATELSFHDFMVKAEQSIEAELTRTRAYLHQKTKNLVRKCCEEEILKHHQEHVLTKESSGLVFMLVENQKDDLERLFRLFSPMGEYGLSMIAKIYREHIEAEGNALVEAEKSKMEAQREEGGKGKGGASKPEFDCIESLLALHDRYLSLVKECFAESTIFKDATKEAFEAFVNEDFGPISTAELCANYSDSLLSQNGMGAKMDEDKIESLLDKLVLLLDYLSQKDLFMEFAQKQLAKRLLMERSVSQELERSFIQKLKLKCGPPYTMKLEGMITDINISDEHRKTFREWCNENQDVAPMDTGDNATTTTNSFKVNGIVFNAHVLKSGHWPHYEKETVKLPSPLYDCIELFQKYYCARTEARVLRWAPTLGKGVLESTAFIGNPKIGTVELTVNTYQICILLMYNEKDEIPYQEIYDGLRDQAAPEGTMYLDDDSMKQLLLTLCTKRYPLLTKKSGENGDVYALNVNWAPNKRQKTLPLPSAKITAKETRGAVHKAVEEDRKHAIESAIVRVMKHHRTLSHQHLVVEVTDKLMQLFTPEPRAIKNRIEELIQREFLRRDAEDQSLYHYIA
ncbi:hypothetical protein NDN08_004281 [Rhodosorus marinus]|uniref:Cullin family profile domain-containing protein n=1 Tax=Rhodosorus marinus TaxID=101924 RepID=A0AAV8UKY0_9RHOD|nr:hypothetical protein NDN08_004281 [Rhodosorus marinus]